MSATKIGINFRGSSGFVTDGTDQTYLLSESYPVTRASWTFGHLNSPNCLDRDNTVDARIAGTHYLTGGTFTFQLDLLPGAGAYNIRLGIGEPLFGQADITVLIKDGGTTLLTVGPLTTTGGAPIADATGTNYSNAAWPGSNTAVPVTFSGSVLTMVVSSGSGLACIAHLEVEKVGGGGFTLAADSGAFTVTGTAAGLKAGRQLAAASGSFAIAGTAAGLKAGRQLAASSGTFAVSGTAAGLQAARRLSAASGSVAVTGTAAGLAAGRKLVAASGSFAVTGTDATLTYQPATGAYTLVAEAGAVVVAGTAATLRAARTMAAGAGSYSIAGTAAGLKVGRMLAAASGAYAVTGTAAALRSARMVSAGVGSFAVTGTDAALLWSGTIATISGVTLRGSYTPTVSLTGSVS